MSGGHFDYSQNYIGYIADDVEEIINLWNDKTIDDWDVFSKETIAEFRKGLHYLRMAQIYAQRIDWLISGDDAEETFHERLTDELERLHAMDRY